jgi:hypothetical protein
MYVQLQPTSLGCEGVNGVKDSDSDATLHMETDKECWTVRVKESQLGSIDVLIEAIQFGQTPDVPVLDAHEPATKVGAFHDNAIKQTSSIHHVHVCYI